jgi:hypothetical protein
VLEDDGISTYLKEFADRYTANSPVRQVMVTDALLETRAKVATIQRMGEDPVLDALTVRNKELHQQVVDMTTYMQAMQANNEMLQARVRVLTRGQKNANASSDSLLSPTSTRILPDSLLSPTRAKPVLAEIPCVEEAAPTSADQELRATVGLQSGAGCIKVSYSGQAKRVSQALVQATGESAARVLSALLGVTAEPEGGAELLKCLEGLKTLQGENAKLRGEVKAANGLLKEHGVLKKLQKKQGLKWKTSLETSHTFNPEGTGDIGSAGVTKKRDLASTVSTFMVTQTDEGTQSESSSTQTPMLGKMHCAVEPGDEASQSRPGTASSGRPGSSAGNRIDFSMDGEIKKLHKELEVYRAALHKSHRLQESLRKKVQGQQPAK